MKKAGETAKFPDRVRIRGCSLRASLQGRRTRVQGAENDETWHTFRRYLR